VSGADACVLVSVSGDVGDELLRCEGKEASERKWCLGWWRKAGECEVVCCYRIRDLSRFLAE